MGQKVSPISLRIGITRDWISRWYASKKDYGKFTVEDEKIRKFVKKEYGFAGIPMVEIERTRERTTVIVHVARPGVIIGRRGAKVNKLTDDLEALVGHPIDLKIIEVEKPELSAQLIAESIAEQLEKRAAFRRTMRKATETVMASGGQGIKILLSGRIGGAEIARREKTSTGKVPLHTLKADIDFARATATLNKGTIGIKVWIYKGEKALYPVKPKLKESQSDVNAQASKVPQVTTG
ncbi:MAG: 30S ribosomal protein S3 [Planctomycetota bacterium]